MFAMKNPNKSCLYTKLHWQSIKAEYNSNELYSDRGIKVQVLENIIINKTS